ncbi:MAG: hypothetical protein IJY85_00120 [Ruminococcus sp.]|nr:hypothetical protein [Ruminococcus sp.]
MNFFMGSIGDYTKSLTLKTNWQHKKDTGRIAEKEMTPMEKKNEDFKRAYAELKRHEEGTDKTLTEIRTKIDGGKKLTPDEMNYLRNHDPQTYQHVRKLEMETKQFERELKNCKTKDEVEKLRVQKVNESLSRIKSVSDNPNISDADKLAFTVQEQRRLDVLNKVCLKFVKTGGYAKLPTEEEKLKAEQDLAAAERAEQTERTETPEEKAEELQNPERKEAEDDAPTRIEAESTPEAQKVRRAKAKAGYEQSTITEFDPDPICFSEA